MKKRTIIIILIGGLVLIAALWGASRHFGWFNDDETAPTDTLDSYAYECIDLENKTKVYDLIILDMSGSMDTIKNSVVEGFNTLIDGLRKANHRFSGTQEHYLSLFAFNDLYMGFLFYNMPIDSVPMLTTDMYQPLGGTPLYDALGVSLSRIMDAIDTLSEYSVMVTVVTDGLENSSRRFSKARISRMIEELSDKGWSFSYLGTDDEVIRQALKLNIDSVYLFVQTDSGMLDALKLDEESRVAAYRAIDSIRRREIQ